MCGGWLGDRIEDVGDSGQQLIDTTKNELAGLDDFVNEEIPGGWATVALVVAGVYYAPEIGAYVSSDGAILGTTEAEAAANAGITQSTAGAASSSVGADVLAAANATSDPIATLNALQGYTYADVGYLSSLSGMTPEILAQAAANNALLAPPPQQIIPADTSYVAPVVSDIAGAGAGGLTAASVINALPLVPVVNQVLGDPLGLNPKPQTPTTGATGFDQVPIPTDWRSPTYQTGQAPIDLNSIFSNQNMLGGTQWQGLPNQRNLTFNDIFAAGQQRTPMGNPVNINQIVSSILGQNTTS